MSTLKSAVKSLLRDQILTPWFNLTDLTGIVMETVGATENDVRAAISMMIEAGEVRTRDNALGEAEVSLLGPSFTT